MGFFVDGNAEGLALGLGMEQTITAVNTPGHP
jgi:hypothetical protein